MPYMGDQCAQMLKISNEFVRLQVSNEEYLCMKVLLLLSTGEKPATAHASQLTLYTQSCLHAQYFQDLFLR